MRQFRGRYSFPGLPPTDQLSGAFGPALPTLRSASCRCSSGSDTTTEGGIGSAVGWQVWPRARFVIATHSAWMTVHLSGGRAIERGGCSRGAASEPHASECTFSVPKMRVRLMYGARCSMTFPLFAGQPPPGPLEDRAFWRLRRWACCLQVAGRSGVKRVHRHDSPDAVSHRAIQFLAGSPRIRLRGCTCSLCDRRKDGSKERAPKRDWGNTDARPSIITLNTAAGIL